MPSIASRTMLGISSSSSALGPGLPGEPGRRTPEIPVSVQRTAQRPSDVSKVTDANVTVLIIVRNPIDGPTVTSGEEFALERPDGGSRVRRGRTHETEDTALGAIP